jgi:predicted nucleotidyltransferase
MKPSVALNIHRDAIRTLTTRFRASNPRVFGSTLHGNDKDGSDLDLVVDALPNTTLFDLGGLQDELQEILGVPVDLLTPGDIPLSFRAKVLAEARAI